MVVAAVAACMRHTVAANGAACVHHTVAVNGGTGYPGESIESASAA